MNTMSLELISASCANSEEWFNIKHNQTTYIIYAKNGITQTISIDGEIDKDIHKEIMEKIELFRLSLAEKAVTVVE